MPRVLARILIPIALVVIASPLILAFGPDVLTGSRMLFLIRHDVPYGELDREVAWIYIHSNIRGTRILGPPQLKLPGDGARVPIDLDIIKDNERSSERIELILALLVSAHPNASGSVLDAWAHDIDRLCVMLVTKPYQVWLSAQENDDYITGDARIDGTQPPQGWSFIYAGPAEAPYQIGPGCLINPLLFAAAAWIGLLISKRLPGPEKPVN